MIPTGAAMVVFALLGTGGLRVETTTPDELCPDPESVRAAVQARVGWIEGRGQEEGQGGGEWLASYTIVHRPDTPNGDVVRLELFDPSRRSRLRRDLPRSDESCTAVAQAIAVVLDLYFRRPAEAPGADANATVTAAAGTDRGGDATPRTRTAIGLFGGWATGPSSPALGVVVGVRFRGGWDAGLAGTWSTAEQARAFGSAGRATLRSYALRAYAGPRFEPYRAVRIGVGPELLVGLDQAATSGLAESNPGVRATVGLGLRAGIDVEVAPGFGLSVLAATDFVPAAWAGTFAVGAEEVFPPAALRLLLGVGLHVSF